MHGDGAALLDVGVLHGLPRRGQDVGEVEVALVGHALGHLDRTELGLRHAQVLRLTARHRAVERGVAEQRGALALLADLGGLARGHQPAAAHPAVSAGDVERHDDAVADAKVAGIRPGLDDLTHRLVPEDVARLEERPEHLVEVEVGPADRRRRHLDDHVVGLLDGRVGHGLDADVALALPGQCSHASVPRVLEVMTSGTRSQRGSPEPRTAFTPLTSERGQRGGWLIRDQVAIRSREPSWPAGPSGPGQPRTRPSGSPRGS